MVWMDHTDGQEFLLVCDQMLWFSSALPHSLINPNHVHAYGIDEYDDPFDASCKFGIDSESAFIPFNTTGMIVHFKSRLTKWEETHLPIILLTGEQWDPTWEVLFPNFKSCEMIEMQMISSMTSGMTKNQVMMTHAGETMAQIARHGEVKQVLSKISSAYDNNLFCGHLISSVNIAMMYQDDIDQWDNEWKTLSITSNE